MKHSLYITAVTALLAGATLTSCSDFLDAENKSAGGTTDEDFFNNNPNALLTSVFSSLKNFNNQADITDEGTDLYMVTRTASPTAFDYYTTLDAEDKVVKTYYVNCYGTINYANGYLKYTDGKSGYDKQRDQARVIRAYAYYCLTQQFGSVPYVTDYITTASRNYPKTELATIYQTLTEELTDIYNNGSLDATDYTSGAPSKQAVAALLSKIYLAWGWDIDTQVSSATAGTYTKTSTEHFAQAAQWASTAIGSQKLTQTFASKWSPSNENNAEFIWSIQYDVTAILSTTDKECNAQAGTYGGYYSGSVQKGCDSKHQQTEKSMYLFEEGDQRWDATFMTTFYHGTTADDAYYAPYNTSAADLESHAINLKFFPYYTTQEEATAWLQEHKSQMVKGSNPNTVKAAILTAPNVTYYEFKADGSIKSGYPQSKTLTTYNAGMDNGVVVRKFDDPTNKAYCFRDIVLLDLSDIYLTAAEANLMAGNPTQFWSYINAVRQRAGLAALSSISQYDPQYSTTTSFGNITELDLVLDERARELYAQKTRYVDLRRTKQLVRYNIAFNKSVSSVADMTGVDGEIKWLRPIPNAEMQNNSALSAADQNPGYRTSDDAETAESETTTE